MVDSEVENILSEIRERVLAEQRAAQASSSSKLARPTIGNGGDPAVTGAKGSEAAAAETLALIDSYLTTTARAWDRLPPVVSNRTATLARLELWLKRRLRVTTRWFTWEQVNFNAAVHHALREMLQALSNHEQALVQLRNETQARQMEIEHQIETNQASLVAELRERDGHLRDEQRVCLKQLSLEASEAAVLEDRARRKTEALLEELKHRIEQLEKKS